MKTLLSISGILLILFGSSMLLGFVIGLFEGTNEFSVTYNIECTALLGIGPIVGGLFLYRWALSHEFYFKNWKTKFKVFWKIYCWFIVIIGLLDTVIQPPQAFFDYVYKCILAVSFLGLFAFVYRKSYLSPAFWKGWFFMHIVNEVFCVYTHRYEAQWQAWIFAIAVASPTYIALFLYAFRSDETWEIRKSVESQVIVNISTTNDKKNLN